MTPELFVGLMSGTSMDGIDAALVAFEGDRPRLLHAISHPWPTERADELRALASPMPGQGMFSPLPCGNC